MEHTGHYYEVLAQQFSAAGLFVSAVNPKLVKNFNNDSLRKVKSDKTDSIKIARYALDKWQNLKPCTCTDPYNSYNQHQTKQDADYMNCTDRCRYNSYNQHQTKQDAGLSLFQ